MHCRGRGKEPRPFYIHHADYPALDRIVDGFIISQEEGHMAAPEPGQDVGRKARGLDPRIARLRQRYHTAPYEVCMARALHFTKSYQETEGMDPHLRNAYALKRTLENQKIFIYPDEYLAGSKTEKFLAAPLSVERGDFLRTLQLEMDILHLKHRPFFISREDRKAFLDEIVPYWDGRTLRDYKSRQWNKDGLIDTGPGFVKRLLDVSRMVRFGRYVGHRGLRKIQGANAKVPLSVDRLRTFHKLRYELANNNPTPAVFVFDVQGHLSLGIDKVVAAGMQPIIEQARQHLRRLDAADGGDEKTRNFLNAVIISLESALHYAARFVELADTLQGQAADETEKQRLAAIARNLSTVPERKPETFHEALQAAWFTELVGEIQYGTHDVFAVGRMDQYLYPYYRTGRDQGILTREQAIALIQEFFLKLEANVEPIPEIGMETNGVYGNSQHVVTIGGLTQEGRDATNELSYLILDAYEQMQGAVNQLAVRIHENTPREFLRRTIEVFRRTNGIAIYNDTAIIKGLLSDGMSTGDARDYVVVGCIEITGQSDTHGCVGGYEMVLPSVLLLTLSRGKTPPRFIGQMEGYDSGDPADLVSFEDFLGAFRRQLVHQIRVLVTAAAGKDRAYREILPAPYVSALTDDALEKGMDITAGGARYDFTSIDIRGLATLVDSLMAVKTFVYDRKTVSLKKLIDICSKNFEGYETLRQQIIHDAPKYGTNNSEADAMALRVLDWIYGEAHNHRNVRGGRFRPCYYSYGNHVIDGIMLGATPDGRRAGDPISNGVSVSNLAESSFGPTAVMMSVAKLPSQQTSAGLSLNMRFHPSFIDTDRGLDAFAGMVRTYFSLGGMHIQPNIVSTETLRDAQAHPEQYRDLIVKVSGYSAYFVDLGKSIQEDIINRYEYS